MAGRDGVWRRGGLSMVWCGIVGWDVHAVTRFVTGWDALLCVHKGVKRGKWQGRANSLVTVYMVKLA